MAQYDENYKYNGKGIVLQPSVYSHDAVREYHLAKIVKGLSDPLNNQS